MFSAVGEVAFLDEVISPVSRDGLVLSFRAVLPTRGNQFEVEESDLGFSGEVSVIRVARLENEMESFSSSFIFRVH